MDTQWPRFFVFKQDQQGEPFLNCGTVHAADGELALLNARDVFVRRPDCAGLWVVLAEHITSQSLDERAKREPAAEVGEGSEEAFVVFAKRDHRRQHELVGEVIAKSAEAALSAAWGQFAATGTTVIWVVPKRRIFASEDADGEAWFAPAKDKAYRHSAFYRTNSLMREIKANQAEDDG